MVTCSAVLCCLSAPSMVVETALNLCNFYALAHQTQPSPPLTLYTMLNRTRYNINQQLRPSYIYGNERTQKNDGKGCVLTVSCVLALPVGLLKLNGTTTGTGKRRWRAHHLRVRHRYKLQLTKD